MGESLPVELGSFDECERAATDAVAWGFPREPEHDEIKASYWYRLGPDVVFWYEPDPVDPTSMAIHIAVRPEARGYWPGRVMLRNYLRLAHAHGAKNLFSFPLDDVSGSILERLGWTPFDGGLVRNLEFLDG